MLTLMIYVVTFFLVLLFVLTSANEKVTFLTNDDFIRAQQLTQEQLNPIEQRILYAQKYFKGDINGNAAREKIKRPGIRRNGVRDPKNKWSGGVIPYEMSIDFNSNERAVIARAMNAYHTKTCVRWVPRTTQPNYVFIGKIDGCYSDVGFAGGKQEISLDRGCITYDTAIHEMMHTVGFWHEHERWDRDQYINVIWENVEPSQSDQFGRVDWTQADNYGENYDFYSIMHYDKNSFSKVGRFSKAGAYMDGNTMVVRVNTALGVDQNQANQLTNIIGRVKDFSPADLRKINRMYNCQNQPNVNPPPPQPNPQPPIQPPVIPQPQTFPPYIPPYNTPAPYIPPYVPQPYNPYNPQPQPQPQPQNPFGFVNSACQDKSPSCERYKSRCHLGYMEKIMKTFCKRTCGFCFVGK